MDSRIDIQDRRTSADVVFDHLYEQIGSLQLLPGAKISEADIASKFGVSRQPVRDAFSRLGNLDLLLIRPQKATVVKKFSLAAIEAARFVRLSVELEVLRKAQTNWSAQWKSQFEENLARQVEAMNSKDLDAFHRCDYDFHKLICQTANAEFAFEIIQQNKSQVDRLCILSLNSKNNMTQLVGDHQQIVAQLQMKDAEALCETMRVHLSRLDSTIEEIYREHATYFET